MPLFALLARRLPETDVRQVAEALAEQGAILTTPRPSLLAAGW
ncbi:hypothetical protein ACQP1G_13855 [Nocardia sp. CA-107356]